MRCGKATAYGRSVCRECNPAGLPEPSPAQYHATVFLAVLLTLVALGVPCSRAALTSWRQCGE
jgi:hypothetical protein